MSAIINGSSPSVTFSDGTTQATSAIVSGYVPYANLPAGSVLQVVNDSYATETSTSSSTHSDTGLTATITPKFATSKILVCVSIPVAKASSDTYAGLKILKNSTNILTFSNETGYTASSATNSGYASANYLDSPATTSATTYKVTFASLANTSRVYVFGSNGRGTITLMEIAA